MTETPTLSNFRSKFGGFWIDRNDANIRLDDRQASNEISADDAENVRHFMNFGFVILREAVDFRVIDQLNEDIQRVWTTKDSRFRVQTANGEYKSVLEAEENRALTKLLDAYAFSNAAAQASFAPKIESFLRLIFESDILAFQNLAFQVGSTQAVHKDGTYVVVSSPLQFAASWIARENIRPGSGELIYYPKSHRFPDFEFGPHRMHWDRAIDGNEVHDNFLRSIHEQARLQGIALEHFFPQKGDALIWHASLAHGGAPIENKNQTRLSYVTHYCPIDVRPNYFNFAPTHDKVKEFAKGNFISSWFYDI